MTRQFSLLTDSDWTVFLDWLLAFRGKSRLTVKVSAYSKIRSLDQNNRLWAILTDISKQLPDENKKYYSPETWHQYFKSQFLGKDTMLIDGALVLVQKSTTKLSVLDFMGYMTQIEAWAIDHGVRFSEREEEQCDVAR